MRLTLEIWLFLRAPHYEEYHIKMRNAASKFYFQFLMKTGSVGTKDIKTFIPAVFLLYIWDNPITPIPILFTSGMLDCQIFRKHNAKSNFTIAQLLIRAAHPHFSRIISTRVPTEIDLLFSALAAGRHSVE
jgi:hypothetical protein